MHFSHIDHQATIQNAKDCLKEYQHYHRIEQRSIIALQSPAITDMPRAQAEGNTNEDKVINHLDAKSYCQLCKTAIAHLEDTYQIILTDTYINPVNNDDIIMDKVHLAHSQFYAAKNEALFHFAEWMPPMPNIEDPDDTTSHDLLVYKHDRSFTGE